MVTQEVALIVCVWQYMKEGHTHTLALFVYHLSVCHTTSVTVMHVLRLVIVSLKHILGSKIHVLIFCILSVFSLVCDNYSVVGILNLYIILNHYVPHVYIHIY